MSPAPLLSLGILADELIGVESGTSLTSRIDDLLGHLGVRPARLYLFDADAKIFFSAAGFGCDKASPDVPVPADGIFPNGHYPLLSAGEWVGMLVLEHPCPDQDAWLRQLCILLAPILVSVHRHQELITSVSGARNEIAKLISAGELLRHLDIDVLLVKILETVMDAVSAEVGAILTVDDSGAPVTRVAMGLREDHVQALRLRDGRSVGEWVLASGEALVLDEVRVQQELDLGALAGHLTGLLALPLTTRNRGQGVVVLANPATAFDDNQRRLAETVCSLAAIALDNALLVKATVDRERLSRELQLARSIQAQMFPDQDLASGHLRVAGISRPCDETGGDYYTFQRRGDGVVALIGDVTGHGLGAALFTTMAHALIQQQLHAGSTLDQAFRVLNEGLMHAQHGRFMTSAAVEVDGSGTITYVSAGHNPMLLISGTGEPRWLHSSTVPLGIMAIPAFPVEQAGPLAPGDLLLLYTDGFTEAPNSASVEFGEQRLAEVVTQAWRAGHDPGALMSSLLAAIDTWTGGALQQDDLTAVVIVRVR